MEKSRRPADFLTIDPSSTFMTATSSRNFEELPENFLESANSPQGNGNDGAANSPQLASLTPMAMSSSDQSTSYQYGSGLKDDGPAGLLSPLHLDNRRSSATFSQRNSGIYIKEEDGLDGSPPQHLLMSSMHGGQADLDRNDATPPAVSNVELASTMITTILGDQASPVSSSSAAVLPPPPQPAASIASAAAAAAALGQSVRRNSIAGSLNGLQQDLKVDQDELGMLNGSSSGRVHNGDDMAGYRYQTATSSRVAPVPPPKRVYSINDANDPLNAEIDDDIYIDTKDLCKRIAYELKQHSIPQAIFAERILCRSQGTLSDLLRNPKPWNKLKSGRETFRRMFNWVQQPLAMRLGILDMYNKEMNALEKAASVPTGLPMAAANGGPGGAAAASNAALAAQAAAAAAAAGNSGLSPPTPAQNVRHHRRSSMGEDGQPANKRPRLVFTDIQKRTLQAIFKETQRPSREMQQTIAEHLRLDLSTVANFFMNARRRSRLSHDDEPAPYQQVEALLTAEAAAAVAVAEAEKAAAAAAGSSSSSPSPTVPTHTSLAAKPSTSFFVVSAPRPALSLLTSSGLTPSLLSPEERRQLQQQNSNNNTASSSSAASSPSPSPPSPSPPAKHPPHPQSLGALLAPIMAASGVPPQSPLQQQRLLHAMTKPTTMAAALATARNAALLAPQALQRKVFVPRANGSLLVPAVRRCVFTPVKGSVGAAAPPPPSLLSMTPAQLVAEIPQLAAVPTQALAEAVEALKEKQKEEQQQEQLQTLLAADAAAAVAVQSEPESCH
ncbi:hypothetical protein PMAYCL1PPCAC_09215 [Pristionchus mayeri]|uniref:One cut domain family member n=1 Tax=Pristionchus mayeri TaxID=1317129 RepID=A0AAN5CC30_9BILA|nr:hypothetical protein PMAYCL1PPCAC_09215 [Pristionchus mayeri]